MINVAKLSKNSYIIFKNQPYKVVEFEHSKMGRGGAVMRSKLKHLTTGEVLPQTFKGGDRVEEADISYQKLQYLYQDQNGFNFMNQDFEQLNLARETIGARGSFLKESQEIEGVFLNNNLIDVKLPAKVDLKVIEAPPGVKGDTATAAKKTVKLETGLELQAPLFIKEGDILRVNTESGEYVERV